MKKPLIISVLTCLILTACEPPDVKVTDLGSFDTKNRDGLVHGTLKFIPPSDEDNAKITHHPDKVILTTNHVLSIKTELYQPSFRLSGNIAPQAFVNVPLLATSSLDEVFVKDGDSVQKGDKLAVFVEYTPAKPTPPPTDDTQDLPKQTSLTQDTPHDDASGEIDTPHYDTKPLTLYAPMAGKVGMVLSPTPSTTYPAGTLMFVIKDEKKLKFISLLPQNFKEYLKIGDAVNFTTPDERAFVGQIANIQPNPTHKNTVQVHVAISPDEIKKAKLSLGELVSGFVEYGQKTAGVLVPQFAIFDDNLNPMDFTTLKSPPYKPDTPLPALIWVVGQDSRLHLSRVHVIAYRPESDYYLVDGVSLTGLIVLADLPKTAQGKTVQLK